MQFSGSSRRFINGIIPAVSWIFLPYTYATMFDETGAPVTPISPDATGVIEATRRSFDIIASLSTAR
jgi:hypothetical protein